MIDLMIPIASDGTIYVPAPCKGVVAEAYAVWGTNAVEAADTIILSRGATAVNTITAVNTAGLVVETGVPTASSDRYLIFDPASATTANQVIKIVSAGAAGVAIVHIKFDDSAYVVQAAKEA